ncbi:hypothetical protein OAG46_00080 [Planctomycetota bacterium]|nr:hypothetical protein [Planctomycetota bacterium]
MGTFSKPGLTRGEERLVDQSGIAINQAIQQLGTNFESQVAMINLNKKAALEQQMQVYKQASEIESSDQSLGNNLAQALRLQADDLYKTTINTMGEDQTEALRKESNLISSVENLGGNLEVINIMAKKRQQMIQEGKSGLVSINSNPKAADFYNNIALYGGAGSKANGVKAVKSRIENGNIILSQENSNGEVFEFSMQGNANAMANGGMPHISFVDSDAINGGYKANWTGLTKDIPALVKQTEEYNKKRGITTNVDQIYEQQSSIAFEKMKNNKAEIALNSSDDFQFLTFTGNYKVDPNVDTIDKDGNALWTGSQEQRERVQLAKAEYAQQQFSNQNVRTKINEKLPKPKTKTSKTVKNKKGSSSEETKKFNFYDELEDANILKKGTNEIDKVATLEKIKSILIDADPGVVIRASDSALDDEIDRSLTGYDENDLYIKVTPSGSKNQPPYKPLSLDVLDRYIGIGAGSTEFGPFIDEEKINDFMITTLQSYQGPSSGAAKFNPKK